MFRLKIEIISQHFLKNIYFSFKSSLISFFFFAWKMDFVIALLSCVLLNRTGIPRLCIPQA